MSEVAVAVKVASDLGYTSSLYIFFISALSLTLIPLIIGLTSTNKVEGIVKGIIGVVLLVILPLLYDKYMLGKCNSLWWLCILDKAPKLISSFLVTFVIIIMAMFVTNS
jgi:hypothetical protein